MMFESPEVAGCLFRFGLILLLLVMMVCFDDDDDDMGD